MRRTVISGAIAASAVALTSGLIGAPTAQADRAADASTVIAWQGCPTPAPGNPSLTGFQCAYVDVPLDYAAPRGRTITLGVVKHPAADSGARLGTVFFNPGGPGDQGSVFLPALLGGFPQEVIDRFDLVSWDPRGMGGLSTPVVQCFDTQTQEEAFTSRAPFPPITRAQRITWANVHAQVNKKCGGRDDALLAHVSTADSARDVDRLRDLLGEAKVWYYGTSYGTFLGATYQNMFPDHVAAIVLDGAIDPIAWTQPRGELSTFLRAGSDVASAKTLTSFLTLCGRSTTKQCAFSAGSAAKTRAKYRTLLARASEGGIQVPGEGLVSENTIVGLTVGSLYVVEPLKGFDRFIGWTTLAQVLQQIWQASAGSTKDAAQLRAADADARTSAAYKGVGPQLSVVCGESPNPSSPAAYVRAAAKSWSRSGAGGAPWPWIAYCADWPVKAAAPYLGPWTNGTAPLMVIGVTGDPATPYSNAVSAAALMSGHLVTVTGYGHTELANPSSCAQSLVADLFVRGAVPAGSPTCPQNATPFRQGG